MAATGYTPISLYYSTTASAVPTAGNLANGELALNIADMKLYAKNSAGTVTLLASNASTTGVDSLSFGSTGLTPSTATTGAITVAGTLNVANGGTGSTSLTAGRVLFGAGTSAVGNSANLFWDNGNSRLGIGTATPRGPIDAIGRSYFQASGSNNVLTLVNTSGGDGSIQVTGTSTTLNYAFNTYSVSNALYIQNDGSVGIGTTSPAEKLHVVSGVRVSNAGDTIRTSIATDGVYAAGTDLYLLAPSTKGIIFYANNTESARISSAGGFSVGTTANPGAGAIYATGNITAYYSDKRLKTVSGKIENALDKVAQLSGVYYTNNSVAKSFGYDSDEVQVGVLAQDVEAVLPQIVKAAPFDLDENGNSKSGENYKTVQYERLVPLLIEAVKELRAEVKALKGE